jgi:hypothetical protein
MIPIALAFTAVYALLTGAVATRLLRLAARTRELPELLLGVAYLLGGVLGFATIIVGTACHDSAPLLSRILMGIGLFFFSSGHLAVALMCWRVFSPDSRGLAALFWLLVAVLVADFARNIGVEGIPFPASRSPWYYPGMLARNATTTWWVVASLSYHARLRRRLALGLADAPAANRVLLWGLAGLATLVGSMVITIGTITGPFDLPHHDSAARDVLVMIAVTVVAVGAVASSLAFLPPRRYVAWIETRASRPPPAPETSA